MIVSFLIDEKLTLEFDFLNNISRFDVFFLIRDPNPICIVSKRSPFSSFYQAFKISFWTSWKTKSILLDWAVQLFYKTYDLMDPKTISIHHGELSDTFDWLFDRWLKESFHGCREFKKRCYETNNRGFDLRNQEFSPDFELIVPKENENENRDRNEFSRWNFVRQEISNPEILKSTWL